MNRLASICTASVAFLPALSAPSQAGWELSEPRVLTVDPRCEPYEPIPFQPVVLDINDAGIVLGFYSRPCPPAPIGFTVIWDADGNATEIYSSLHCPNEQVPFFYPFAINNNSTIVGPLPLCAAAPYPAKLEGMGYLGYSAIILGSCGFTFDIELSSFNDRDELVGWEDFSRCQRACYWDADALVAHELFVPGRDEQGVDSCSPEVSSSAIHITDRGMILGYIGGELVRWRSHDDTKPGAIRNFNVRNLTPIDINDRLWAAGTDENGNPVTFQMIAAQPKPLKIHANVIHPTKMVYAGPDGFLPSWKADPIAFPTGDLEGDIRIVDMNESYQILGYVGDVPVVWQAYRPSPDEDECIPSDTRQTVWIGGEDTGVANDDTDTTVPTLFDSTVGCTVADLVGETAQISPGRADFLRNLQMVLRTMVMDHTLTFSDSLTLSAAAAEADLP